jgi:hypothetical protein
MTDKEKIKKIISELIYKLTAEEWKGAGRSTSVYCAYCHAIGNRADVQHDSSCELKLLLERARAAIRELEAKKVKGASIAEYHQRAFEKARRGQWGQ